MSESLHELFGFWADATPDDAAAIVAELRAYFTFEARVFDHENAGRCLSLVTSADAVETMHERIEYEITRRTSGCVRSVRDGNACARAMSAHRTESATTQDHAQPMTTGS
jgi:hypothetical protein